MVLIYLDSDVTESFGPWLSKIQARKLLVKRQITLDLISYLEDILKS